MPNVLVSYADGRQQAEQDDGVKDEKRGVARPAVQGGTSTMKERATT
jgi:hypothetical protein